MSDLKLASDESKLFENYSIKRVTLIDRLAELYKTDCLTVAKVCDEVLDRSGALLGEVRERQTNER